MALIIIAPRNGGFYYNQNNQNDSGVHLPFTGNDDDHRTFNMGIETHGSVKAKLKL